MLRRCSSLLRTAASVDFTFRRALGSQSTLLDLVPVKKPLIEGSLCWFIEENIDIVLVSGVKGTSPDEVTDGVKFRATRLLQQCGGGDAVKGCHALRRCAQEASTLRRLLHRLDLRILLRVWDEPQVKVSLETLTGTPEMESGGAKCDGDAKLHCSIYEIDTWEPDNEKRHLKDISASPSEATLDILLRRALQVVERDAENKERQLAVASFLEARLLLLNGATSPFPKRFRHPVLSQAEDTVMGPSCVRDGMEWNPMLCLAEDPATRWIVYSTSYKVELKFLRYSTQGNDNQNFISGAWELEDDVGNTERGDVHLVALKSKKGLVFDNSGSKMQVGPPQENIVDEDTLEKFENAGELVRVPYVKGKQHVSKVLHSLWDQPIMQSLLLYTSVEFLCGHLCVTRAEDYVRSCGRLEIDSWLNDQGRSTTVPMTPLYLHHFTSLGFLQECLPLELGTRIKLFTQLGPLHLGYHVATAPGDRVVTPVSCFSSATAALAALLPWYPVTPLRPVVPEQNCSHHYHHHHHQQQQQQQQQQSPEVSDTTKSSGRTGDDATKPTVDAPVTTVRVLDVEAVLKTKGVVTGTLASDQLEYFDALGRKLLHFEQMNTLGGIERMVRCLRRSRSACFTNVSLHEGARTPYIIAGRALAGLSINKAPPYVKRVRIPVPLMPGEFFGIRFTGLLELEQLEYNIISIFERFAEDPANWPLRRRTPCFFNRWRFTKGIIATIMRHDATFRYTIDPASGEKGARTLVLRLYSGDTVMREASVQEEAILLQVRNCFIEYVAQWTVDLPPLEDILFGMLDIKRTTSFSYRNVLNAMLQNSEVYTLQDDSLLLELHITTNVSVILASEKCGVSPEVKEMMTRSFVVRQFAMLLPFIALFQRAQLIVADLKDIGEAVLHCQDNSAVGRGFRWELQKQTGDSNAVEVIDAAEGPSRWVALGELVDRYQPRKEARKQVDRVTNNRGMGNGLSIEEYQVMLARKHRVQKIIHEYNKDNNVFVVKGINYNAHGGAKTASIICVIPLKRVISLGCLIHRYYRKVLQLPNPPALSSKDLRGRALQLIYSLCQPHFALALPPLDDVLSEIQTINGWNVILRLPGKLFALEATTYVEYAYIGRGKHEGRREVLTHFYNSIYGDSTENVEKVLLDALSSDSSSYLKIATANGSVKAVAKGKVGASAAMAPPAALNPCGKDASMYGELMRVIGNAIHSHVGYDGVVECRLSFISGIRCRYVRQPFCDGELVDLFNVPLRSTSWLPLQLLHELVACALRVLSENVLCDLLLGAAAEWPSLFLDINRNERLFCTTFLRRYLGLCSYEENDVDPRAVVPGTIYLVESSRRVGAGSVESSLFLVQTPLPPHTSTFKKRLALEKGASLSRTEFDLWSGVAHQLEHSLEAIWRDNVHQRQQQDVDRTLFDFLSRPARE